MRSNRVIADLGAVLVIVVATYVTFVRTLDADFTSWDDYETVARNPLLNPPTARSLQAFWARPHGDLYIPVTYSVWAGVAAVPNSREPATQNAPPRLSARGFHLFNVTFHICAAMMAYGVLEMLVAHRGAALVGALLFALHPLQVESVAWVSGMKDALFGALSLVAIYEYLKFVAAPSAKLRRVHYAVATATFILAMLAKPTAMVLPLVIIVLDYIMLGRPMKQVLRSLWPWLLLAVPCAIATKLMQPAPHAAEAAAPLWARPLIAADAIAFYLYKLVWPAKLGFDYGRTPHEVRTGGMIAWTWLVPVMAAVLAWWSWRRGARAVAAGLAIMIIVLLPVLGLVPFDFQTYSTVADHYMYLAMLGPALIVAWLIARRPSTAVFVAAACLVAVLGFRGFIQTAHWRDSVALFNHGLEVNPRSFAAYNSLAAMAIEKDRPGDAIALIERALAIRDNAASHHTRGEALRRAGRPSEAIAAFETALKLDPEYVPSLANLAAMLAEQGRLSDAIPLARRAVELEPHSTPSRLNLALMYLNSGQPALARPQLEAVLQSDPDHAVARDLLRELPR